jgi:hypothetical protein
VCAQREGRDRGYDIQVRRRPPQDRRGSDAPEFAIEYPDMDDSGSLAEALQLVHYNVSQEYTAHHDFGCARYRQKGQPARFATLLL